jgi:hypothetical protein
MVKSSIILILLFCLALSGNGQGSEDEKEVLQLSKAKFGWMVNKKIDSLGLILDDRLMYIHSNGWVQSKKEVLDDLVVRKLIYEKVELSQAEVRRYENTYIVNGKGKFAGSTNSVPFAFELVYTEVYIKNGKQWLLVSRHASKLP